MMAQLGFKAINPPSDGQCIVLVAVERVLALAVGMFAQDSLAGRWDESSHPP